jgi:hypothetical protein
MTGRLRIGPSSHGGGDSWCTWAPIAHIRQSAITIESAIVTRVCRRSWPGMKRKIDTCMARPTTAAAAKPAASAKSHDPVNCAAKNPR